MYTSEQDVRAVLTYEALIPAIRQALIDYSAGRVNQPQRMILRAGNADDLRNGWFAVMPVVAGDVMGVKTVTFYPGNDELGLPTHMAMIELLRRATGEPLALMDGRLITEMRTAAVSAVAFEAIALCILRLHQRVLALSVQECRRMRISRPCGMFGRRSTTFAFRVATQQTRKGWQRRRALVLSRLRRPPEPMLS